MNYLSQLSKAPINHPHNNQQIYEHLHLSNPYFHPRRRSEPAAGINQLPHLHERNVVHITAPERGPTCPSVGELFLQGHALPDLDGRPTDDANRLRWTSRRPGSTSTAKSKSGGGVLTTASAPPTFSTFAGVTPRQIAAEFAALRKLKPNLRNAVCHLILSPGPEDKTLSKEDWKTALDIALAEHGATDAPHACYLHEDTDNQHLQCFVSRILPTGQVVSDSHSYQKNRSASKKIIKELQLIPFSETPNPTAPGDRTALDNAARSAERRGDALVDAALVRSALQQSRTRAEYYLNLRAVGIEIGFPVRGKKNEIFGSSMRAIGSETWIKSSTLAKDLSWPKIKQRFPEADWFLELDPAEQIHVAHDAEAELSAAAASRPTRSDLDLDRMPAIARNILAPTPLAKERADEPETGLNGVSRRLGELAERQASPLLMSGLVIAKLGVMCLQLSIVAAKALWAFIMRLLSVFGIGLRQVQITTPVAPLQLAPTVSASTLAAVPAAPSQVALEAYLLPEQVQSVHTVDASAAAALQQVLDCVESGRLADLPLVGDGKEREALVAALAADDAAGGVASGGVTTESVAPSATADSLPDLATAVRDYINAAGAIAEARSIQTPEVDRAREVLKEAQDALSAKESEHALRMKTLKKFVTAELSVFTADEAAVVRHAQTLLKVALAANPTPIAPALSTAFAAALSKVKASADSVYTEVVAASLSLDRKRAAHIREAAEVIKSHSTRFVEHGMSGMAADVLRTATAAKAAAAKALRESEIEKAASLAQAEFDAYIPPISTDAEEAAAVKVVGIKPPKG